MFRNTRGLFRRGNDATGDKIRPEGEAAGGLWRLVGAGVLGDG